MSAGGKHHPWLGVVVRCCIGRPYTVLTLAGLLCLGFAPFASQFVPRTKLAGGKAVKNLKATQDGDLITKYFHVKAFDANFVVTIALKSGRKKKYVTSSMLSTGSSEAGCQYSDVQCTHRFWQHGVWPTMLQGVRSALQSTRSTVHHGRGRTGATPPILDVPGLIEFSFALNESLNHLRPIYGYSSNATLWAQGIATRSLINEEGTATQITWKIPAFLHSIEAQDFSENAYDVAEKAVHKYLSKDDIDWGLASLPFSERAATDDAEKSALMMDAISLPLTVLVLWYMLRSIRLLVVPVLTVAIATTVSYGIMFVVAHSYDVTSNTPGMMMSMGIAMTIDYCLFILTRFRAELLKSTEADVQKRVADATAIAMDTGGWAVLVSGSILACAFAVVACFPMPSWQLYGVGGTTAIVVLVVVHLTVLPAFLQLMPDFFSRCAPPPQDSSAQSSTSGEPQWDWVERLWRRIASLTSDPWKGAFILLLVMAMTVSIGYKFSDMKIAGDFEMFIPQATDAWDGQTLMVKQFGTGTLAPFQLMMVVDSDKYESFLAQEPWEDSQIVLKSIVTKLPHTEGIQVSALSFSYKDGVALSTPWAQVATCMEVVNANNLTCVSLHASAAQSISPDKQALLTSVVLTIDPAGEAGKVFTRRLRDLLEKLEKTTVLRFAVSGGGTQAVDILDRFDAVFPYVVMTTFILAFAVLAVSFRSLVYPFTCVLTIGLTLLFTYGLAVRIYQEGFMEWTGVECLRNRFGSLPFGNHMGAFSIIVGLCLDYDIFLMNCITEFRAEGLSAKDAVVEGLCHSGGIITAAGIIMTFSFTGLMYCTSVYISNIQGYFLTTAVLFDTFIMRSFVAPAAMIILGRFNWWPSELAYDKPNSAGSSSGQRE